MRGWKKPALIGLGVAVAVAVVVAVVTLFADKPAPDPSPAPPAATPAETTPPPSALPSEPVRAPYGSTQTGTIGDYAVPAWPVGVSERMDDPRFVSWLQQAPPTIPTQGWAPEISDEVRQDPVAFTRTFLDGFYTRQYTWPRSAWASWVWDAWTPASLTPTPAYAAEVGQPSTLYRERAWFLLVAMAPTRELEDIFAPASQEAWHRYADLGATSSLTTVQVSPIEFPLPDLYYDTDPHALTMEARLSVATTVGGQTTTRDLHLWVALSTADETGGYGVQAVGVMP